jgi:hypothetical protein
MKRIFGVTLLVLPLLAGSLQAAGCPFNIQADCSFHIKGSRGPCCPQAGPWYLYWPLEAHFVAPAPTGYPYWPSPQGLPPIAFGGPTCPPGVPVPPPSVAAAPPGVPAPAAQPAPQPVPQPAPQPAPQSAPQPLPQPVPQATPSTSPGVQLPPYLQPTSYYAPLSSGQPPSYWYDR